MGFMKNKIVLEAETEFKDEILREYVQKLETKIATINDRTKIHTTEIRELHKKLERFK